jgi:aminoglycoside phosphotransferase (APT) family kinase protein
VIETGRVGASVVNAEYRALFERLRSDGVVSAGAMLIPLAGGISSDIYHVVDGGRSFVVKQALPSLRVRDAWQADVSRNEFEQRYLRYVGKFLPDSVPKILFSGRGYFAMEFLGAEFRNWKAELLAGAATVRQAAIAGKMLGVIHAKSHDDPRANRNFDSGDNFAQLRVDPYFRTLAQRFSDFAPLVEEESSRLLGTQECLVHGDFSPKNLMFCGDRLMVLDCEVAWYGDPAFDVAFCLSHLLLKALYHAPNNVNVASMATAFHSEYGATYSMLAKRRQELEERIGRLLLLLLAARVDGKSPVEYLDSNRQEFVREFTLNKLLSGDPHSSMDICSQWLTSLAEAKLTS